MCKEEDREGQENGEEREEERKVGSRDGSRTEGTVTLSNPSACATSKVEECKVEGEKQAEKHHGGGGVQKKENSVYGSKELSYQVLGSCFELWNRI